MPFLIAAQLHLSLEQHDGRAEPVFDVAFHDDLLCVDHQHGELWDGFVENGRDEALVVVFGHPILLEPPLHIRLRPRKFLSSGKPSRALILQPVLSYSSIIIPFLIP